MKTRSKRAVRAIKAPALVHMSAYANNLNGLIPDLYAGLDVVSRELVGFIPSVSRDPATTRAAVGQETRYHVTEEEDSVNIVPAMSIPEPPDRDVGYGAIVISKSRAQPFGWTGEEQRGLNNNGPGYLSVQADWFAQGLRKLVNEIEADLALEAITHASRATGTAGNTPFSTNLGDAAQLRKILDDNGAPLSERSLVGDTTMGAALRTLQNLTRVNEAGTTMTLRDGELLNIHNFSIKESGASGVMYRVKGTAAGATTNAAGYAVGSRTITLASAGTGTIVPGDVITFAGDTNKYVVVSGDASVADGGTITIGAPGLLQAIPASAQNITVLGNHVGNVGFSRNAMHLAQRLPALPQGGDAAIDRTTIVDPRSGLPFEVSLYAGYRKIRAEIACAWGVKAVKQEHIAMLLG